MMRGYDKRVSVGWDIYITTTQPGGSPAAILPVRKWWPAKLVMDTSVS